MGLTNTRTMMATGRQRKINRLRLGFGLRLTPMATFLVGYRASNNRDRDAAINGRTLSQRFRRVD